MSITVSTRVTVSLYCDHCARWDVFSGYSQTVALDDAKRAGWAVTKGRRQPNRVNCPAHRGARQPASSKAKAAR